MRKSVLSFAAIAVFSILAFLWSGYSQDPDQPQDDLSFLVDVHIDKAVFSEKLANLKSTVALDVGSGLDRFGAHVLDQERFASLLFGDLGEHLETHLRTSVRDFYREQLSQNEIRLLADYYRSDEGQLFLAKARSFEKLPDALVSSFYAGPGRPLAEHAIALQAQMQQLADKLKPYLQDTLTLARVASIAEMPEVVAFEDERQRDKAVAAMRASSQ